MDGYYLTPSEIDDVGFSPTAKYNSFDFSPNTEKVEFTMS
jgi:hypothetical protein